MTDLSVFSRRRMYGRTSARSGAYGIVRAVTTSRLVKRRERLARSEQAGVEKVEDGPEIAEPILHRRAAERDARARVDLLGGPRLLGAGCLDRLRFVQDGETPRHGQAARGDAQQRSVARDDEVDVGNPIRDRAPCRSALVIAEGCATMRGQRRREALDFRGPVGEQRRRRNQQAGAPRAPSRASRVASQHQQQRQHLHRLAEAHVVGEAGAQAEAGEQMQPSHADLLIGSQRRLQRGAGIQSRQVGRIAKAGERLRQPRSGDDA